MGMSEARTRTVVKLDRLTPRCAIFRRHSFASLFLIDGGDIFKLSKILGHATVTITERTYAHLKPDAYEADYGRVAFRMPTTGNVVELSMAR